MKDFFSFRLLTMETNTININKENFYESTFAIFVECEEPNRAPDFVSVSKKFNTVSYYWFDSDENGCFVVRKSDHWNIVRDCQWLIVLKEPREIFWVRTGKSDIPYYLNKKTYLTGKCYFHDMSTR